MKKNLLISFLMIGFAVCFASVEVSADTNWKVPASPNDLEGRWEIKFPIDIPENNNALLPKSSIDSTMILECSSGYYVLNMVFNMDRFLTDLLNVPQIRQLGFTKETLWGTFLHGMFSEEADSEYDIFVRDHTFIFSVDGEINELLSEEDSQSNIFINEDKNMIRLVFSERIHLGLGDKGFFELIMKR